MTCPCGDESHDYDKLLDAQARTFIARGASLHDVWRHWSDPKHRNYKGEVYMQKLTDRIRKLKAGEAA